MSLYLQFADLFDYPDERFPERMAKTIADLEALLPEAARCLEAFYGYAQEIGISRLQEAYTSVFDLQPECTLNLSYHLFGEDQRRGMFLAKLKELYAETGIDSGTELPDHLCYLLRYVGADPQRAESKAVLNDCLIPCVSTILQAMKNESILYGHLLKAFFLWLGHESAGAGESVSPSPDTRSAHVSASSG